MAITEAYSTTLTISSSEISFVTSSTALASVTTDGAYQFWVDVNTMAAGDVYEFRVKEAIRPGSTQRTILLSTLNGPQTTPYITPTLILIQGWDFTAKMTSTGVAKSLLGSIRQVS